MNQSFPIDRRGILRLFGGLLAAQLPMWAPLFRDPRPELPPQVLGFVKMLRRTESARIVGREYLRQFPQVTPVSIVAEFVELASSHRIVAGGPRGQDSSELCREVFRRRQLRDFEEGRTVTLQGWVLSKTEAHLCALVAAHPSRFLG